MFKYLKFDNVNLKSLGVYISGDGVYDSPERDTEAVEIPGRNGDLILDNGRFKNITVTYPAGVFGSSQTEFSEKISAVRNLLASRIGYKRIEDEYHPDEFRLGEYVGGLEVDPKKRNEAGEFNIEFNCKPQRFLKSGEVAQTVTNNGTITNPTYFESAPLLEVEGYGNIQFNGYDIAVNVDPIGEAEIFAETKGSDIVDVYFNGTPYNTGDQITVDSSVFSVGINPPTGGRITNATVITSGGAVDPSALVLSNGSAVVSMGMASQVLTAGTSRNVSINMVVRLEGTDGDEQAFTDNLTLIGQLQYYGNNYLAGLFSGQGAQNVTDTGYQITVGAGVIDSTKTPASPLYIDCEIGEAYALIDGVLTPFDSAVELGADLPRLKAGGNTITMSNTITSLKIRGRWWKI